LPRSSARTAGILANQGRKQKARGWRGRENGIPEANSKVAKRKAQSKDGEKGKISYLNKHAMRRSVQKRRAGSVQPIWHLNAQENQKIIRKGAENNQTEERKKRSEL
jgi:hypothetical protein